MSTNPSVARAVDGLLEATVALSFSKFGYLTRRRVYDWPTEVTGTLSGTAVVTGATSGLGLATATELARRGMAVCLVGRDAERGHRQCANIRAAIGTDRVSFEAADIGDLASVRTLADRLEKVAEPIRVVVHNAGALSATRTETADGLETTFAVHVAGPHLLTARLAGQLRGGARVIWVSSGGLYSQRLHLEDLQSREQPFRGSAAYARAKRAQVVLMREWAARLAPAGIAVHAMHPGWADTPGVQSSLPRFHQLVRPWLRSPGEGADTIVWLATSAEAGNGSGGFWLDRRLRSTERLPGTATCAVDADKLWDEVVRLSDSADLVPGAVS